MRFREASIAQWLVGAACVSRLARFSPRHAVQVIRAREPDLDRYKKKAIAFVLFFYAFVHINKKLRL